MVSLLLFVVETSKHVDYFHVVFDVVLCLSCFLTNTAGEDLDIVADNSFVFELLFELI
jgi:hypothetical protein